MPAEDAETAECFEITTEMIAPPSVPCDLLVAILRSHRTSGLRKLNRLRVMDSVWSKEHLFLSASRYAVVGASKDEGRWATKILKWYVDREMDVTPIHPVIKILQGLPTIKSLAELSHPTETSVSLITPPAYTIRLLELLRDLEVPFIWLQPGVVDEACITFIEENNMQDKVIWGGSCLLTAGDRVRRELRVV